jgi:hypothetical protein
MEEIQRFVPLIAPLVIIELILLAVAFIDLVRREQVKYFPKWLWAIIILLINFIRPIIYLIIGREDS